MDEKVLDEIRFHQETVSKDANSPLHLIREKEMEIAGRVLAAKREAEELVATARRKAAESVAKAEDEAEKLAAEREKAVMASVVQEAADVATGADKDAAELEAAVAGKKAAAVEFLIESITASR